MKLLGIGSNAKTVKSDAGGEYLTAIMYLSPGREVDDINTCPGASKGCLEACLYTAGRGNMVSVKDARMTKTEWFRDNQHTFLLQLRKELKAFSAKCTREGVLPAVRLNGTSDIRWERYGFMEDFPEIQFYDYTKIRNRRDLPDNYHLTFSRSEEHKGLVIPSVHLIDRVNVAVVFEELPKTYFNIPVIDGDKHDLRFTDPKGVIVGLKAKGKAKGDTSGFVVRKGDVRCK